MDGNPKVKAVSNEVRKMFKFYITSVVLIYVAASILASQKIIDVESNNILLIGGVLVGVCMILYQVSLTISARKQKKLEN